MFIDASHVRAHQHATGIKDQAISKSVGENTELYFTLRQAMEFQNQQPQELYVMLKTV